MTDSFEVVYYSHPTPNGLPILTLMGLLFDRVHFPGVYIPRDFDPDLVSREIERLEALPGGVDLAGQHMIACMHLATIRDQIEDLCFFTGKSEDVFGTVDAQARHLSEKLAQTIFGPVRAGYIPTYIPGWHKQLPGSREGICLPAPLVYAANAVIYATGNELPMLSDEPSLPVIGMGSPSDAQLEKALTAIVALEALKLVLPSVPIMHPESLRHFRAANAGSLKRFRGGMLHCSRELMAALRQGEDERGIVHLAKKIVEQDIRPSLENLRSDCMRKGTPWYEDLMSVGSATATLAGAYYAASANETTAAVLLALTPFLVAVQKERDRKAELSCSPLFYLLTLEKSLKK